MALNTEEVRKIADLARLRLSDAETEVFARQLGEIVTYVDRMADYETADPGSGPGDLPLEPFERADETGDGLSAEVVLANAPESMDSFVVVPAVNRGEE